MNRKHLRWYLLGAVILVAALAVGGVRGTAWVYVLIGLTCPLMMVLMMGGMHGSGSRGMSGNSSDADESGRTRPGELLMSRVGASDSQL